MQAGVDRVFQSVLGYGRCKTNLTPCSPSFAAYVFQTPTELPFTATSGTSIGSTAVGDWSQELQDFKLEALDRFPFLTGIEMRVFVLDPESEVILPIVKALQQDSTRICPFALDPANSKQYPYLDTSDMPVETLAFVDRKGRTLPLDFPGAFLVKAQGLRVWGLDLQALLPQEAARPSARARPTLRDSIKQAMRYGGMHREEGDYKKAGAVYKWALKRCIRAGFEATVAETGEAVRPLISCRGIVRSFSIVPGREPTSLQVACIYCQGT